MINPYKRASKVNKTVYSNIDTLMKFLSNLPDVYSSATVESKQKLLRLIIEKVTYDTETEKLTIKLKPIFQALRITKNNIEYYSEKVTTLPKVSYKTVLEYMAKNIETSLKNKVTTIEKLIITKKEPLNETLSKNGAGKGLLLEPCLKKLHNVVLTVECEYCLYNLSKIAA